MKTGRNDPCPCGSGKKYKKCCLEQDQIYTRKTKTQSLYEPFLGPSETDELPGDLHTGHRERHGHAYQAQKDYPAISDEEHAIVDDWWDHYKSLDDTDTIRKHLENFMQKYPKLVENLELDTEVLFELGADYRREDRFGEYIALLLYIKERFPETYVRSAGYYDADIINWLVSNGRTNEVKSYFNYFFEYPVDFVEQIFDVCNLSMAVDATGALIVLVSQVREVITASHEVLGGDEILIPLIFHKLSDHIRPGYSEEDIDRFVRELREDILPWADTDELKTEWTQRFADIMRPYGPWTYNLPPKKDELNVLYDSITDNFMRYLHDELGLSWISAQFHAGQVYEYMLKCLKERKGNKYRQLFDFSTDMIDKIGAGIAQRDFLYLDSTILISLLNAIHYFADYLVACDMMDEAEKQKVQDGVSKLYTKIYPMLKNMNSEALCFSRFPFWH